MTEWQPISTAPQDGSIVLGYFPAFRECRTTWNRLHLLDGRLWATHADRSPDRWSEQPTHWMPLPEPPINPKS